ncbi:MAG TPA: ABC transporter permease, partial [Fibrobacteria bacterium]|nr:ABC transporter permease [Fibrobacteria bacterium]
MSGRGAGGISPRRIGAMARKEVRHILRDWQTLIIVLVMPVVMMFLYGYALNSDARDLPVAVEDPSPTPETRALAAKLDAGLLFEVTTRAAAVPDPAALFRAEGIRALVRLPPGFARDLRRPGGARVQVLVDGSDPNV